MEQGETFPNKCNPHKFCKIPRLLGKFPDITGWLIWQALEFNSLVPTAAAIVYWF